MRRIRASAGPPGPRRLRHLLRGAVALGVAGSVALGGGAAGARAPQWSIVPAPLGGSIYSALTSVSCAGTSYCVAVGNASSGTSTPPYTIGNTLIETWDGTSWSITPSPDVGSVSGSNDVLDGVSCPSALDCTAVGYEDDGDGTDQTLIESWDGTSWTITPSPDVGGSDDANTLAGVSCVSPTDCVAVGSDEAGALIETGAGGAWSVAAGPTGGELTAVSCVSATYCVALDSVSGTPAIESWNGAVWSVTTLTGEVGEFVGVSCVSTTDCVTVGRYDGSAGGGVFSTWNGRTWQEQGGVIKDGGRLAAVSCVSATLCVAAGSYDLRSKQEVPPSRDLIAVFNGRRWSLVTKEIEPRHNRWDFLYGVSCVSATTCTAVGSTGGALVVAGGA
jgi:hypothetical protein